MDCVMGYALHISKVCLHLYPDKLVGNEIEAERRVLQMSRTCTSTTPDQTPALRGKRGVRLTQVLVGIQYATRILVSSFPAMHVKLSNGFCLHKRWKPGDIQLAKPAPRSSAWPQLVLRSNLCAQRWALLLHRDPRVAGASQKEAARRLATPSQHRGNCLGHAGESQLAELTWVKNSPARRHEPSRYCT